MGWVSYNSQCRGATSFLTAKHDWTWSNFHERYTCKNRGCTDKLKKEHHPDNKVRKGPEYDASASKKDLMFGKVPGTIKGGKWGNKADKKVSSQMHRQNPPKTDGEKAGENKGCFDSAVKGAGAFLIIVGALAYGAYEGISSLLT